MSLPRLPLLLSLTLLAASTLRAAPSHACVGSEPACASKATGASCASEIVFGVCERHGCEEVGAMRCSGLDVCAPEQQQLRDACAGAADGGFDGEGAACEIGGPTGDAGSQSDADAGSAVERGTCKPIRCASTPSLACYVPRRSAPVQITPSVATPAAGASDSGANDGGCSASAGGRSAGGAAAVAASALLFLAIRRRRER